MLTMLPDRKTTPFGGVDVEITAGRVGGDKAGAQARESLKSINPHAAAGTNP